MTPSIPLQLRLARVFAWSTTVMAFALVMASFERLPDRLPVTQVLEAPRTLALAVRIPAINLLTLALVDALTRTAIRAHPQAESVAGVLFAMTGTKALLETIQLLRPEFSAATVPLLIGTVLGGLTWAAIRARPLMEPDTVARVRFERAERVAVGAALAGIVALQTFPHVVF